MMFTTKQYQKRVIKLNILHSVIRFVRVLRMKLFYYGIFSFLCFTFLFLACDGEVEYQYYLVVDSKSKSMRII